MFTIDMVKESLPPAERYQQTRKELIEHFEGEIKRVNLEKPDIYGLKIETTKKAYVMTYYSFPYIEKYLEWEYTALAEPVISAQDLVLIGNTIIISLCTEAVNTFIYSVSEHGYLWEEFAPKYIDNPEEAEKPLTEKTEQQFIFFLDNVFKPAFLELVENIKQGHYRPLEEIQNEMTAIWNNPQDIEFYKFSELFGERSKPRHDLIKLMQKYSKACNFHDVIGTEKQENYIFEFEPLEKVQAFYPETFAINITKPAHFLSEIEEFNVTHRYIVSKKNAKAQQLVSVTLFAGNEENVKFSRPITMLDRAIIDTVETLAECNEYITVSTVYRMMNGGENTTISPETKAEFESRIEYLRQIMVTVDFSQHLQMILKRELTEEEKKNACMDGLLLNVTKCPKILNGKVVSAYKYNAVNPLTAYAKAVKQIATVPAAMLNTKDGQRGGKRAQSIKQYLIQRIYTISGQGDTIKLDHLLKAIGEETPSAQQLRTIRQITENYLDLWSYGKIKTGKGKPNKDILLATPIKGYSVKTIGKKITGYILIPKVVEITKK